MDPVSIDVKDGCPNCGQAFLKARVPTDEQYARSLDKENPELLTPAHDTASPAFRAEHGELHRCVKCDYHTRVKVAPKKPAKKDAE